MGNIGYIKPYSKPTSYPGVSMVSQKTILLFSGLCLLAAQSFALDPHFKPPVDYSVGTNPEQVISADFDGDGKPDLAAVNSLSNSVSILKNNGNGTFAAAVNYAVTSHPTSLCAIDVDADGFPDLAVANYSSASISILMNLTNGTFDVAVDYSVGIQPTSICAADFDGDVKIDLAVANSGSGNISVLINLNNSKFPTAVNYTTGTTPSSICTADFNADGKPDLAVANAGDNNVSTLINNGNGTFAAAVNHAAGATPVSVFAKDVDGNGSPDLAVANSGANTLSVLKNNGTGTFAAAVDYGVGNSPNAVIIHDLNKDGKPELASADMLSDSISVLTNGGTGTFGAAVKHAVGTSPMSVCAADFDGDLTVDLAVANSAINTVSVLIGARLFKITASAGANGTISPVGVVDVYEGTDQTFTIIPSTGYHVAGLTIDGSPSAPTTSFTFMAVGANHTIAASFAINQYTITSSAGSNGLISPSGAVLANYGSNSTFAITPNIGYHVLDVVVDGFSQGPQSGWTFTFVSGDHTISAAFAINTYTITVSAGINGMITPSGVTTVDYGGGQTYSIAPNSCYHVLDVLVDGISVGAVLTYPFTNVSVNRTISATFAVNVHTVTASAGPHGTITPGGSVPVNCGLNQSFTMHPSTNYHVADVLVDGISVGAVISHTINNVTKDYTINARFACCNGLTGNVDCDPLDGCDISDLSALIDNLYISLTPLCCREEANIDASPDGNADISDLSALIDYLYISMTPSAACR
jgi:hypothetical protein